MNTELPGYGLWTLAALNAAFFIFFAWSFYTPRTTRDWRSFGMYSAFVVALFAEMYGFPLSLFLLSGWLSSRFPEVRWWVVGSGCCHAPGRCSMTHSVAAIWPAPVPTPASVTRSTSASR